MSIKILYFASLKDSLGKAEDEISPSRPLTPRGIWQQLNPDIELPDNVLSAVNMEYVGLDAVVNDGDELAFFPPVTGG
jgi:sulfur-carrier protein